MCLAIPGRVVEWVERDPLFARARVEFAGVSRNVNMQCASDAAVDDYVLVHAGMAISAIDSDEAKRILSLLEELELTDAEDNGDSPPERNDQ